MGDGTPEWDTGFKPEDADSESNHEFHPSLSTPAHAAVASARDRGGPFPARLMLAISTDGKTWEKTGMVIANHASVPCLAVEENEAGEETLYLFFVIARDTLTDVSNANDLVDAGVRDTPLAVAYTTSLTEWTYRFLDCEEAGFIGADPYLWGLEDADDYVAVDPSVVRAIGVTPDEEADPDADYQWMMYYTLHTGSSTYLPAVILVAFAHQLSDFQWTTGNDGLPVLPPAAATADDRDAKAEDPSALPVEIGGDALGYTMFAGGNLPGYNWVAAVGDGVTVDFWEQIQFTCSGVAADGTASEPILMNNAVDELGSSLDGTWIGAAGEAKSQYIVAIAPTPFGSLPFGSIAATVTYDTGGCDVLLEEDPDLAYEYNGISEAAVARFGACWVMVYVTGIEPSP